MASTIGVERWAGLVGSNRLDDGDTYLDIDPALGEGFAEVVLGSPGDVDEAVTTARRAFAGGWRDADPATRGDLLRAFAQRITEHLDELALLETLDTGKPQSQARTDATVTARYFQFYANCVEALSGETIVSRSDLFAYTLRQPYGVTAHILPWNYPLQMFARTVSPALAAGNCVVVKPATAAPLTPIRLGELALEAGFPPGVVNIVPGHGTEVGLALARHPEVGKISFTGSVEVGTLVAKAAAENIVPVTLELGGKSANVVFADADLERAVPVITNSILQHAGQSCVAGSRLLVHKDVEQPLLEALQRRFESIKLGRGVEDPDMGPLISEGQREIVESFVEDARGSARVVCGGQRPSESDLGRGYFFLPTIIADVDPSSRIAQEEVFGPVLAVTPFGDDDEAVELANSTRYGLAGAIWTRDVSRAHAVARGMEAGTVHVNGFGVGGGVEMPSGGFKQSGYGREKGFEGMIEFTQLKSVHVRQ